MTFDMRTKENDGLPTYNTSEHCIYCVWKRGKLVRRKGKFCPNCWG